MKNEFPDDPCEGFRRLSEFPGYGVTESGQVWSCRLVGRRGGIAPRWSRVLPNTTNRYHTAGLRRDGKTHTRYIHRLVLEAFTGPCPDGHEGCHRDGDSTNNRLSNLRWGTSVENKADCRSHGTLLMGEKIKQSKLKPNDIRSIFRMRSQGLYQREIADEFGVSRSLISQILNRRIWAHLAS